MKTSWRGIALGLAVLGLSAAVAGCHKQAQTNAVPSPAPAPPAVSVPAQRGKAVVYVINPKATGDQDPLMPRTVTLRHPDSPARDAVEALLGAGGSPMPAGTALRGLTIDNGLATLDFSQSPVDETGGEGHQTEALTALGRTLGQFPGIRQYQIEVKGRIVTAFGEFTTDGPIDVVRPDAVRQAKVTAP